MNILRFGVLLPCLFIACSAGCSDKPQAVVVQNTAVSSTSTPTTTIEAAFNKAKQYATKHPKAGIYFGETDESSPKIGWHIYKNQKERDKVLDGLPMTYATVWEQAGKPAYMTWETGMSYGRINQSLGEYSFHSNGRVAAYYYSQQTDDVAIERKKLFDENGKQLLASQERYRVYSPKNEIGMKWIREHESKVKDNEWHKRAKEATRNAEARPIESIKEVPFYHLLQKPRPKK